MTATLDTRTADQRDIRLRAQVLVDLDGCLLSLSPWEHELDDQPGKWQRFFQHTIDAPAVPEGMELVGALRRLGWQFSVSTTRPRVVRSADGVIVPQLPLIKAWAKAHLPASPRWVYTRGSFGSPVDVKLEHFYDTGNPITVKRPLPKTLQARPAILFIDDEIAVVDGLVDRGIPSLAITDLAGTPDSDLEELLTYSAMQARHVHRQRRTTSARQCLRRACTSCSCLPMLSRRKSTRTMCGGFSSPTPTASRTAAGASVMTSRTTAG